MQGNTYAIVYQPMICSLIHKEVMIHAEKLRPVQYLILPFPLKTVIMLQVHHRQKAIEGIICAMTMILCYGDSLTAGYGVESRYSYPSRLQERLLSQGFPHRVVNAGVSGDTTAQALSRLGRYIPSKPEIAIVTLGANDGLGGYDLGMMRNNLEDMVQRLQRAGTTVILSGMEIPAGFDMEYVSAFSQVYPQLAAEHDLPFIPSFLAGVAGIPEHNLMDGFHPNEIGYGIILENVWRVLLPLLENREQ